MPKTPVGIRLSEDDARILDRLAKHFGTKAAAIETALRDLARKLKLK
jgi:hypothetical protein